MTVTMGNITGTSIEFTYGIINTSTVNLDVKIFLAETGEFIDSDTPIWVLGAPADVSFTDLIPATAYKIVVQELEPYPNPNPDNGVYGVTNELYGNPEYKTVFYTGTTGAVIEDPLEDPLVGVTETTSDSVSLEWNDFIRSPLAKTDVAIGVSFGMALQEDGTVCCWGSPNYQASKVPYSVTNVEVANVSKIASGLYHALVLKNDGTVMGWGNNSNGQLDDLSSLSGIVSIATSDSASVFVKSDGTVEQRGRYFPPPPTGLTDVSEVAVGWFSAIALKNDGTLVTWGNDYAGQMTIPAEITSNYATKPVTMISNRQYHTLALRSDGSVVAWGNNTRGECNVPAGVEATFVAAGFDYSLAVTTDGSVVAWGNLERPIPTTLSGITRLSAYTGFLTLDNNGVAEVWNLPDDWVEVYKYLRVPSYYEVLRDSVSVGYLPHNRKTFTDTGLEASTSYTYTIQGRETPDILVAETTVQAETAEVDPNLDPNLGIPSGLLFIDATYLSYKIKWNGVANATGYEVYRDGTSIGIVGSAVRELFIPNSSADSYSHQIRALGVNGYSAFSQVAVIGRYAAPTNLSATNVTSDSFTLSWSGVPAIEALPLYGYYEIFRNNVYVADVNSSDVESITLTGLTPGDVADYSIRAGCAAYEAVNNTLFSHLSNPLSVTLPLGKLATPTGLAANDIEGQIFTLTWDVVLDAEYYTVKYADHPSGPFSDYSVSGTAPVAVHTNTLLITNLVVGAPRYYVVVAHAEGRESSNLSTALSVIGKSRLRSPGYLSYNYRENFALEDTRTDSSFLLSWEISPNVEGVVSQPEGTLYNVYQDGVLVQGDIDGGLNLGGRVWLEIAGLTPNTSYEYTVQAINPDYLDSELSQPYSVTTRLQAPSNVVVTEVLENSVALTWDSVPGALGGYRVSDGKITLFCNETNVIFPAVSNKEYTFSVVAVASEQFNSSEFWSVPSDTVSAKTLLRTLYPKLILASGTYLSIRFGNPIGRSGDVINGDTIEIYKDDVLFSTKPSTELSYPDYYNNGIYDVALLLLSDAGTPLESCQFTFKLTSSDGNTSLMSNPLSVTFPDLLPAPQNLRWHNAISSISSHGFSYTWDDDGVSNYQISYKREGETEWTYGGFGGNSSDFIEAAFNQTVTVRVQGRRTSGADSRIMLYTEYAEEDFLYPLANIADYDIATSDDSTSVTVTVSPVADATGYELLVLEDVDFVREISRTARGIILDSGDGAGALYYSVGLGLDAYQLIEPTRRISSASNVITVNGLQSGQYTNLLVRAVNNVNGNYSYQTWAAKVCPAAASSLVEISAVTSDSILLKLAEPSVSSAWINYLRSFGTRFSYNLDVNGALFFDGQSPLMFDDDSVEVLLSDLEPETDYNISILTNAISVSHTVDGSNARTWTAFSASAPFLLSSAPEVPTNLVSSNVTANSFDLSWTATTSAEKTFKVYLNNELYSTVSTTNASITGLNSDTVYNATVFAVVDEQDSYPSDVLPVTTMLETPTGLSAIDIEFTSFTLIWGTVDGAEAYEVYKDGVLYDTVAANLLGITDLLNTETYTFEVKAISSTNFSEKSEILTIELDGLLDTPVNLVATNIGGTQFTLSWDAVTGATSYEIYRNGNFGIVYETATTNSQAVSGLTPATSYTFAVKALSDTTFSAISEPLVVDTIAGLDTPVNLVASDLTSTSVTLSWDDVLNATSYEIYRNNKLIDTVTVATLDVQGLNPHTGYQFTVVAVSDDNISTRSEPLFVRTRLSTPINLIASEIASAQFKLSWDTVEFAKVYIITYDGIVYGGTNGTSIVVENLSPETTYAMRVQAFADDNSSDLSNELSVTTLVGLAQPTNLQASGITGVGFTLSWDEVVGAVEYEIYESEELLATVSELSVDLTDLTQGATYYMQVRAVAGDNFSAMSDVLEVFTLASIDQVIGLVATNIRGTAFTLSWDASAGATSYEVYKDGELLSTVDVGTTLEIVDLVPATSYDMQVKALGDVDSSEMSEILSVYTVNYLATPILTASSILGQSLILSWQEIDSATSYEVYQDDVLLPVVTENTVRIESLVPATKYTFSVKAIGESNYSEMSEPLDITTYSRPSFLVSQLEIDKTQQFDDLIVGLQAIDGVISLSAYNIFLTEGGYYWRVRYNGDELTDDRYFEVVEADGEYIVKVTNNGETIENTSQITELQWDSPTLKGNTDYSWNVESKSMVSGADFVFSTGEQTFIDSPSNIVVAYDDVTGSVTLTWDTVPEATGYKIMYKAGDWNAGYGTGLTRDSEGTIVADSPIEVAPDVTSLTLYGLVDDSSYWFFVQSVVGGVESDIASFEGNVTVVGGAGGKGLAAPRKLYYVYNQSTKEIVVSWEPITE